MRFRPVWIVLALLVLPPLLLAAGWSTLPSAASPGQCASAAPIVPSEAGAVTFSTAFRAAILDNSGGPFRLRATDVEVTSYVALNTQGRQLADPQIRFLDNAVCLSGRIVGLGLLRPRFRVLASPYLADGEPQLDISSLVVNGRELPASLRHLAQRITNESIRDAALPIRIDALQVQAGEVFIAGERTKGD